MKGTLAPFALVALLTPVTAAAAPIQQIDTPWSDTSLSSWDGPSLEFTGAESLKVTPRANLSTFSWTMSAENVSQRSEEVTAPAVPEPGALVLLGSGLVALAATLRRQRRR